jgi:DNA-binding NtrC family response regulator
MKNTNARILCVDYDDACCRLIHLLLDGANADYEVISACSAREGLEILEDKKIDLCIFDLSERDHLAAELCRRARLQNPEMPIVIFSGKTTDPRRIGVFHEDLSVFLAKPLDLERLAVIVCQLLRERDLSIHSARFPLILI